MSKYSEALMDDPETDLDEIEDPNAALIGARKGAKPSEDDVRLKIEQSKYGPAYPLVRAMQTCFEPCMDSRAPVLIGCMVGIIGSLMMYGLLQERIMTQPYGEDRFTNTAFLVLNSRLWASVAAAIASVITGSSLLLMCPWYKYLAVSFSNFVATSCQYEALKYVNFPTQTLGKCAKMIPVMIWGTILSKKKYTISDYAVAFFVTIGSAMFLVFGDITSGSAKEDKSNSFYGLALMVGYLLFDGFTSTWQSKLFTTYDMSTYNLMFYVNLFSAGISIFTLATAGQIGEVIDFVSAHPSLLSDAILLSCSAVFAQFVITFTIKRFGALIFATIMTTRQFLSILVSTIVYAHPMTFLQWAGTCMVFSALYYSTWSKHKQKKKEETRQQEMANLPKA